MVASASKMLEASLKVLEICTTSLYGMERVTQTLKTCGNISSLKTAQESVFDTNARKKNQWTTFHCPMECGHSTCTTS